MEIISTILAIIISTVTIGGFVIKKINEIIATKLIPIETQIQSIETKVDNIGVNDCKNYLISYLARVELGLTVTNEETAKAYEEYDKYTNVYHQNSYVHRKWHKLMESDKKEEDQ